MTNTQMWLHSTLSL